MKLDISKTAKKQYDNLPENLRLLAKKQFRYLLENPRHPSLNVKKYQGVITGLWQARVNQKYRFYFQIRTDTYAILAITDHQK